MPEILWNPAFSVGNPLLDSQHKKLLAMCARLDTCINSQEGFSKAAFHEVLNDMTEYASVHFKTEEMVLKEYGYKELEAHRKEHFAFEEMITLANYEAMMGLEEPSKLTDFLKKWWLTHILESDMRYASTIAAGSAGN